MKKTMQYSIAAFLVFLISCSTMARSSQIIVADIDAFSGRINPSLSVDLDNNSKLAMSIHTLLRNISFGELEIETDADKAAKAEHGYGGITLSDPTGELLSPTTKIVVKPTAIVVDDGTYVTVYVNDQPKLFNRVIKHAYKLGELDLRAASTLWH